MFPDLEKETDSVSWAKLIRIRLKTETTQSEKRILNKRTLDNIQDCESYRENRLYEFFLELIVLFIQC
jgi:hypothetical protein